MELFNRYYGAWRMGRPISRRLAKLLERIEAATEPLELDEE